MKIIVNKETIFADVTRTTLYTGAKHPDGSSEIFSRIAVIDSDRPLLSHFCDEALASASLALRRVLESLATDDKEITISFRLSQAADEAQAAGIADSLTEYMKTAVIARWLAFSDKAGAETYTAEATRLLDDCLRKALYKRKPTRPNYKNS